MMVHYATPDTVTRDEHGASAPVVCGAVGSYFTTDPAGVKCADCRDALLVIDGPHPHRSPRLSGLDIERARAAVLAHFRGLPDPTRADHAHTMRIACHAFGCVPADLRDVENVTVSVMVAAMIADPFQTADR